jgi:integrase
MSKIAFYLNKKQTDKNELIPIYVKVEINLHKHRHYVGYKVKERQWNITTQSVDAQKKNELPNDHEEINERLDWYRDKWRNLTRHRHKSEITREMVNDLLWRREVKKFEPGGPDFFTKFEEYIITMTTSEPWRPGTVRGKKTVLKALREWDKDTRFGAGFGKISTKMNASIHTWCNQKMKYAPNHVDKIITTIKAYLRWCVKNGYYDGKDISAFESSAMNVTHVSLTSEEFFILLDFMFTRKPLAESRDIYCFSALTGQRIGDIMNLRWENIIDGIWYLVPQKSRSGEMISVPIISLSQEIIDIYHHHPVFVMPQRSLEGEHGIRKMVKEACKEAGINTPIAIDTYPGGVKKTTKYEKWEKINLHTGRKTFTTISLSLGTDQKLIRSITGHKRDAVFDKYGFVVNELKRKTLESIWQRPKKPDAQDNNKLQYRGFTGSVEYNARERLFFGKIESVKEQITFRGSTVDELEASFREMVDKYIENQPKII